MILSKDLSRGNQCQDPRMVQGIASFSNPKGLELIMKQTFWTLETWNRIHLDILITTSHAICKRSRYQLSIYRDKCTLHIYIYIHIHKVTHNTYSIYLDWGRWFFLGTICRSGCLNDSLKVCRWFIANHSSGCIIFCIIYIYIINIIMYIDQIQPYSPTPAMPLCRCAKAPSTISSQELRSQSCHVASDVGTCCSLKWMNPLPLESSSGGRTQH